MDVDLSTDLAALLPLVAPLLSGHSDLAIGTRLSRGSRVVRGPKRELISRLLQRHPPRRPAGALLGRAVRLQGDPRRLRARAPAARPGPRLVLRHRAARARRARRPAHPRGAGRLGRRPRLAASTSSRPRSPISRGVARLARDLRSTRPRSPAARSRRAGVAAASAGRCCASRRSASSRRSPTSLLYLAPPLRRRRAGARTRSRCSRPRSRNTAATGGSPSRVRGAAQPRPPPGPGARRVRRSRSALTSRLARRAARARRASPSRAVELAVLVAANLVATVLRFVLFRSLGLPRPADRPERRARGDGAMTTTATHQADRPGRARRGRGRASRRAAQPRARPRRPTPAWVRPALLGLLAATGAALPRRALGAAAGPTRFYSAAVQAGTKSWKAFFFGSFDSSNFITVDKPPAVALGDGALGAALRRQLVEHPRPAGARGRRGGRRCSTRPCGAGSRPAAGLLAGAVLALTPVAALMFRFNNPDALLTLLLVGARVRAHARARAGASTRWLAARGRADRLRLPRRRCCRRFVVVPGFALVYLLAAPTPLRRRVAQLLVGRRRDGRGRRLVGRDRRRSGPRRAGPTSAARRTTASST